MKETEFDQIVLGKNNKALYFALTKTDEFAMSLLLDYAAEKESRRRKKTPTGAIGIK